MSGMRGKWQRGCGVVQSNHKLVGREVEKLLLVGKSVIILSARSGRSAVRLAHLVWVQGVAGSNPAAPTMAKRIVKTGINIKNLKVAVRKDRET